MPTSRRVRASKPFESTSGDRSGWLSHTLATMAIAGLGLVVAGTISIAGPNPSAAGQGRAHSDQPDTTQAVPALNGRADGESVGRDGGNDGEQERGTLNTFDRRQQSTSREAVRQQLNQAAVTNKAKERRQNLGETQQRTASNNRGLSAEEREKELAEARAKAVAEAKRQAEEAARKAEEQRRLAAGGLTPPTEIDTSHITGTGAVAPLPRGAFQIGARWGAVGSWARWHTGQDLPAAIGTPVLAAKSGVVMRGVGGWAGHDLVVRHADGSSTLYAHMGAHAVGVGSTVQAGQIIGYVGMTGRTFGPHLHFEYYPPGATPGSVYTTRNPMVWLRANGAQF